MATAAPVPAATSQHDLIRSVGPNHNRTASLTPPIRRIPNRSSGSVVQQIDLMKHPPFTVAASTTPGPSSTTNDGFDLSSRSCDVATGTHSDYDVLSLTSSSYDEDDLPPAPPFIPPPPPPLASHFLPPPPASRFHPPLPPRPGNAAGHVPVFASPGLPFRQSNVQPPLPWHPTAMVTNINAPIAQYRPTSSIASDSETDSENEVLTGAYYDHRRREWRPIMEAKMREIWHRRLATRKQRSELYDILRLSSDLSSLYQELPRLDMPMINNIGELQSKFAQIYKVLGRLQAQRSEKLRAYEALEADLAKEEADLTREEARLWTLETNSTQNALLDSFYGAPGMVGDSRTGDTDIHQSVATIGGMDPQSELLLGISGDRPEDIHPLYLDLLDAVGDRELAREFEEELKMHREKILSDLEINLHRKRMQENPGESISEEHLTLLKTSLDNIPTDARGFKARFGVDISEDDLDFLRDYDCELKRARRNLERCSKAVGRRRDLCVRKGVMRRHASYNEQVTILLGSDESLPPGDGNMTIELPNGPPSLSHPRFPVLLSNPSHVLEELSPQKALENALALPRDSPESAQRRAECMKELGITVLMKNFETKPDYINQWLIHRLRTSPLETELMLAVFEYETKSKVMNLRRWQEDVLYHWRLDEAANKSPLDFDGPRTPIDGLEFGEHHDSRLNSDIAASSRARSENGDLRRQRTIPSTTLSGT